MKAAELFKPWKPKKPKKRPDPWFFAWGGVPVEGDGQVTVEGQGDKKHKRSEMPDRMHLDKSFYMQQRHGTEFMRYDVKQFLDSDNIATVNIFENGNLTSYWKFNPNKSRFPNASRLDTEEFVSLKDLYNPLKLKWWVTNRLIQLGVLPSKVS